ncbi:16S rRNA (uracil(1498)-N(3))-methyltransferase [Buchnera aphidicola (Artemisaphis artemisicola)]|uniref:Ribosomal RNA small subunit methyltransferase E n=2 Tax=Buchnera aphidicola TaxID=9 RepID=A0A4D6XLG1_9GAMM|nr:16S rRNA (uracil(1498)-N(3))-methyltransferase [Buchnera aphidicola]QCI16074.1 16S rRNA (uracil(1498)-N(3))-methyltransferase [Buchnera aphidicola (Artemisaphis artemisicola)]
MTKHIPRIYINNTFMLNKVYSLSQNYTQYIKKVLRMKVKDIIEIFNNTNHIFLAEIIYISKKIQFKIIMIKLKNVESPLHIHLGQVISKNDKMEFTIQKSIEMGVNIISPLFSEYCSIQKRFINFSNKIKRWENIAIASCQQCNRNIIPQIKNPQDIFLWCKKKNNDFKIVLDPNSSLTLNQIPQSIKYIRILIGPEGGFSDKEIKKIIQYGFVSIRLGPRILRTETASIAAITALQMKFGDLNFTE